MTFKEFFQFDELVGQYGSVRFIHGPIGTHTALRKILTQPIPTKQSRIKRSLAAGKCKNPNRPVIRIIPNTQMTLKSVL